MQRYALLARRKQRPPEFRWTLEELQFGNWWLFDASGPKHAVESVFERHLHSPRIMKDWQFKIVPWR